MTLLFSVMYSVIIKVSKVKNDCNQHINYVLSCPNATYVHLFTGDYILLVV